METILQKHDSDQKSKNAGGHFFKPFIRPKLSVNQPGDHYEQEADAMADKVMRMTDNSISPNTFFKPADRTLQRKCQACEEEDTHVHRKENNSGDTGSNAGLDNYVSSLGASGQPMSAASRSFFEPRFGRDFSNVKVHTDSVAAKSAQSINALAYTTGNNIVFNSGQYSPDSDSGKKLMAHELTHVVQQGGGKSSGSVQRQIEVPAGTALDTMGYTTTQSGNVYTCPKIAKSSIFTEIFTAMLHSPRTFKLSGKTNDEVKQSLNAHIAARLGIIDFASKKKYAFGAGDNFKMNSQYWNQNMTVKPGKDPKEAINDLNVHPKEYAIACRAATLLTMLGGSNSTLREDVSSDAADWVPGDWGYIENTSFAQGTDDIGLEGENIIYVGKDQFWGHFGPGNTYNTLQGWIDEVNGFNDTSSGELKSSRRFPTTGLQ
jgi:Domain of unknown function (DUF4157)/Protein-glutamine gamma-glutamyltransferase